MHRPVRKERDERYSTPLCGRKPVDRIMKRKGKVVHIADQVELNRRIRKDWGGLRPVTQVRPNKKHYSRKEKHRHIPDY